MIEPPSTDALRRARLEAIARKALAVSWARGLPAQEANGVVLQMIHEAYPEVPEDEIVALIRAIHRHSA